MPLSKDEIRRRYGKILLGRDPREQEAAREKLEDRRQELLSQWEEDSYAWMTGKDINGKQIMWTRDERDKAEPVKAFPSFPLDKPYLQEFGKILRNEQIVALDKSRQMLATTFVALDTLHMLIFEMARTCILSKASEEEAKQLLDDKMRFPYRGLPDWFKEIHPVPPRPRSKVLVPDTGSYILAVGMNVAGAEARGCTASRVVVDEAAFQRELEYIVGAVLPMGNQLVLLTTANLGNPGAKFYREQILEKGKEIGA